METPLIGSGSDGEDHEREGLKADYNSTESEDGIEGREGGEEGGRLQDNEGEDEELEEVETEEDKAEDKLEAITYAIYSYATMVPPVLLAMFLSTLATIYINTEEYR